MALPKLATSPTVVSLLSANAYFLAPAACHYRPSPKRPRLNHPPHRHFTASYLRPDEQEQQAQQRPRRSTTGQSRSSASSSSSPQTPSKPPSASDTTISAADAANISLPPGWEDNADFGIDKFSQLPHRQFGYNQHIKINEDFKDSLRQILWQFRAPIRYAFAYGSGVFGQKTTSGKDSGSNAEAMSPHPNPPKAVEEWQKGGAKIIDFIFGVSHTQHWHSLNLAQNPDHYSGLKWLPYSSAAISHVQDDFGAGVYFNPFITVNGTMIKYGVVKLDTLSRDLSEWDTLYLAGRLQKPVKILRDDPRIRLANQINLISALRTALLMLPETFTERQLYERIAGLSYLGDPRMNKLLASENPNKVSNIVGAQLPGFRQLYVPLIQTLPNVRFTDPRTPSEYQWEKEDAMRHTGLDPHTDNILGGADGLTLTQTLDPVMRGNMVRRLPSTFRKKLYYKYKSKFRIPGSAFSDILESSQDQEAEAEGADGAFRRREGGEFEQRIAQQDDLPEVMAHCIRKTVSWPATSQTVKSFFTAGVGKAWKYYAEKRKKGKEVKRQLNDGSPAKPDAGEGGDKREKTE